MSLTKKTTDFSDEKTSVDPAVNTKRKNTQLQNPNDNQVSLNGNTTDGNDAGKGVNNIRNNPQGNNPMSVDRGGKGPGKNAD